MEASNPNSELQRNIRKKSEKEDRISNLPDSLILHILSLLPTKISATTSILSKDWHYFWNFVPILDFDASIDIPNYNSNSSSSSSKCLSDFVSFINRCIILNQSPDIYRFRVRFSYKKIYASDVDVWLCFAFRKKVKELELDFSTVAFDNYDDAADEDDNMYIMPMHMFVNNPSLETLSLCNLGIDHGRIINWNSLKFLCLQDTSTCDDFLVSVFSASPALELFQSFGCYNYTFLDIESPKLTSLLIHRAWCVPSEQPTSLKITAPYLRTLIVTGIMSDISIINVPSLVDASLFVYMPNAGGLDLNLNSDKYTTILVNLLGSLRHVKELALESWCLEVLSMHTEKALPCMLSSRVTLLFGSLCEKELSGMARLLAQTHQLDTLVINMENNFSLLQSETRFLITCDLCKENYWSSHQGSSKLAFLHLKTVRIVGFLATKNEVELLLFLLKKAPNLEKMIINPHDTSLAGMKKTLEIAQILLNFPRLSRDAVVLFC